MAEAALLLKIQEAEDAVTEATSAVVKATDAVARAQATFDGETGDNKQLCGQLLAAKENVLAAKENVLAAEENVLAANKNSLTQLRGEKFSQQQPSIGSCCVHFKSDGSVLSRDLLGLPAWLTSRWHACLACIHSLYSTVLAVRKTLCFPNMLCILKQP